MKKNVIFHFLYNTKMYRFCNGQISAPCHRNSEHRRIGLIGRILIQMCVSNVGILSNS